MVYEIIKPMTEAHQCRLTDCQACPSHLPHLPRPFQVVYEIIKPMTEAHQCRLTDYPDKSFIGTADVGRPEYFIR